MNGYMNRVDEMGVVSAELEKLLGLENDYWKVRSKSHWLREGIETHPISIIMPLIADVETL